jgi:HAD superfamily hydrolase (TIGR01549 family)
VKLITLDFEGTLVDFQWRLAEAVRETVRVLSQQGVPEAYLTGMDYASIYNFLQDKGPRRGFPAHLVSLVDEIYDRYDLDAASRWRPAENLAATLEKLQPYRLALVSNVGRKALTEVLARYGLLEKFDYIVSRNDVRLLKPAPEGLLKVIEWAGVDRRNVLHVGDSLSDIEAARKAGVRVGVVLGGESDPEHLLRREPDLVLSRIDELPGVLRSLGF